MIGSTVSREDVLHVLGRYSGEITANEVATMLGHTAHGATRAIVGHLNEMFDEGLVYRTVLDDTGPAFWGIA